MAVVRFQLRGGFGALLLFAVALLLALLAFLAGLAFLLPLAALGILAAGVRAISGVLGGRRRESLPGGKARLPASEQVVEVAPVDVKPGQDGS